ncbi:hypothetical protein B0T22DRAFT_492930 [Podospora appendiculata]|uniref:Uncharacterized protein n=1 Tax=Podospora appendiculata TaxID=314037 RepID=A0AAE0X716_9PEZI|nr:hypothetical protein B0T22DRAFT_492930 [Podospora appendiculata]
MTMGARNYRTIDELDDLEEEALDSTQTQRLETLVIVATIFNQNKLGYGLIGGTNFFLRGSNRTTTDVDIAVSNDRPMADVLNLFNDEPRITRPAADKPMLWVSGVGRTFVTIGTQLVQVDLKSHGEGHSISHDFEDDTENIQVGSTLVRFFKMAPLVRAKLRAHYIRETSDDYHDLRFACTDQRYAPQIKQASRNYPYDERELFIDKVVENHPMEEDAIREVMNLPRSSGSTSPTGSEEDGRGYAGVEE